MMCIFAVGIYKKNSGSVNQKNVEAIYTVMRKNYEIMKQNIGLSMNEIDEPDKLKVDDIFEKLRPDSPYKLSEMLNPDFNPKKKLEDKAKSGKEIKIVWKEYATNNSAEEVKNYYMYDSCGLEYKRNSSASTENKYRHKIPSRPRTGCDVSYQTSYHRSLLENARKSTQNVSVNNMYFSSLKCLKRSYDMCISKMDKNYKSYSKIGALTNMKYGSRRNTEKSNNYWKKSALGFRTGINFYK